jgi:class 3 adenylate cyclase
MADQPTASPYLKSGMFWTIEIEDLSDNQKISKSFDKPEFTIGRHESNDLVIPNLYVSRRHVVMSWKGDHAVLEDQGSVNGTYICANTSWTRCNEALPVPMPLHVMIGPEVSCRIDVKSPQRDAKSVFELEQENAAEMSHIFSIQRLARTQSIMVLDLADSTRLANQDEAIAFHTKKRLEAISRMALFANDVQFYKSTGDGFVAAFNEASDALNSAREIMSRLSERNSRTRNHPIRIRIALHHGKTYVIDPETQDIHGNDVNITFRIDGVDAASFDNPVKPLPLVDRILCSQSFLDSINKQRPAKPLVVDYCGQARLKGIKKPMDIYSL